MLRTALALDEARALQDRLVGIRRQIHPHPELGFQEHATAKLVAGVADKYSAGRRDRPRHWRTRTDPFETVWPQVVLWLECEPDRTAKELFERLRHQRPADFAAGQLRTLQRKVKEWRRLAARRLVFAEPIVEFRPSTRRATS